MAVAQVIFSVGNRAFGIFSQNLSKIIPFAAAVSVPSLGHSPHPILTEALVFLPFTQILIIPQAVRSIRGRPIGGFSWWSRIVPIATLLLLQIAAMFLIVFGYLGALLTMVFPGALSLSSLLGVLVMVVGVLIWPLVFLGTLIRWSLAIPACLIEGLGPLASLRRSAILTKGNRREIFVLIFVLCLIGWVAQMFLAHEVNSQIGGAGVDVALFVWNTVFNGYVAVVLAIAYCDLHTMKDNLSTALRPTVL